MPPMPRDDHASEPFGYFYDDEGDAIFEEIYVTWPDGVLPDGRAPGVAEGLALAGFVGSPTRVGAGIGTVPVFHAYVRDEAVAAGVPIARRGRAARFAVVLRQRGWTSLPLFFADLPTLAEFEAAVGPLLRLLDRRDRH